MNKSILKSSIGILVILSLMLIFLTGCSSNDNNNKDVATKTNNEIKYLENRLVAIANKVNNITFSMYGLTESKQEQSSNESGDTQNSQSSSQGGSSQNSQSSSQGEQSGGQEESSSETSSPPSEGTTKYGLKQSSILLNKDTTIDWDYIKYNAELLYSTWTTILIDLHSLNVDNNDILNFGKTLDNLIIAVKAEDKVQTLNLISDLYSYIPKYLNQYSDDSKQINISYTKYYVIDSYTLSEEDKWAEMENQITQSKNYFSNIVNSFNDNENNQDKANKVYVLLNEIDNAINVKDKDLFYIKYKALMENIDDI